MTISAVIPTCNRRRSLLQTLGALQASAYPLLEIIILDAGEEKLTDADLHAFPALDIRYYSSLPGSVCMQRNAGIRLAEGELVFLCDDDIEITEDYLQQLVQHMQLHPACGAVSGLVLQQEQGNWVSAYPLVSARQLIRHFVFGTGIWGPVQVTSNVWPVAYIKKYYQRKGNHLSRAGWPVITNFEGGHVLTPTFGLGAALLRRSWLLQCPYDEVLDPHGIGDHYGVAVSLPAPVHLLPAAKVFHHREQQNRLQRPLQYYRRVLALDHFRKKIRRDQRPIKFWLLWSLAGNFSGFCIVGDWQMLRPSWKAFRLILFNRNPYRLAAKAGRTIIQAFY
ncbi:MAG: glycosyltransferase family 2 protein [Pseudobacter sp.]|uniref:glycosyltransferase family 2 protein n=1 Tax=Pseudobacter sp. TaxID=2045420 RepID=UPI003F7DB43A